MSLPDAQMDFVWPLTAERKLVRDSWVEWLTERFSGLPTLRFTTLTFAPTPYELRIKAEPSFSRVVRAAKDFEKFLIFSQGKASFFGVMEIGKWNGRRHLHFLISGLDGELMRAAIGYHEWRSGYSATRTLESTGGIPGYVTKYVMKSRDPFWIAGGPAFDGAAELQRRGDRDDSGRDQFLCERDSVDPSGDRAS